MTERPICDWVPSPNFTPGSWDRKISAIIIHATATSGLQSPLDWLCNPKSKASCHYMIDLDGRIARLVCEKDISWHAGISAWRDRKNVNMFSVGLELVNLNDGKMEYPKEQIEALVSICVPMCVDYGIGIGDIVGHADVAPGRKNDPLGFPWDEFRSMVKGHGIRD